MTTPPVLYVWKSPRPADADEAAALVDEWRAGDPADIHRGPMDWHDDVVWFHREITGDAPPVWNPDKPGRDPDPPDRVIAVELQPGTLREQLEDVYGLAMKYDLIVYDPQRGTVQAPLEAMSAAASATFWPRGAVRAAAAGIGGAILAGVAWVLGIPVLSGVLVAVGVFLVALTVATFVFEARRRAT